MHVLGVNLPDRKLLKIALTSFHGVSHNTSRLICARLGFHDRLQVSELTEPQINELSALLSSPSTFMSSSPSTSSASTPSSSSSSVQQQREHDRLANLTIESDLRRQVRANIQHHRTVGSYRGRRHAMGFPVRGQRTKSNAKTAKKLNRVERRAFSTSALPSAARPTLLASSLSVQQPPTPLLHSLRWRFRLASLSS